MFEPNRATLLSYTIEFAKKKCSFEPVFVKKSARFSRFVFIEQNFKLHNHLFTKVFISYLHMFIGFASRRAIRFLNVLFFTTNVAGCLVTSVPTYSDEPYCPPILVTDQTKPSFSHIVNIDIADPNATQSFSLMFRSCAVTKTFTSHIFLDENLRPDLIIPSGTEERSREFSMPYSTLLALGPGCHRVEWLISTRFQGGFASNSRIPEKPGDLAQAVWWLNIRNSSTPDVDPTLRSCPQ